MNESMIVRNREPAVEILPAPSALVELPIAVLREVSGGDIGSGLIVIPK